MNRLLKEPLLHFTLIGALIWGVYGLFGSGGDEVENERVVRISAAEVEWLAGSFASRWNRPPTRAELDGLVRARVEEEVLYREALAMGLEKGDQVIRRRLAQKLEFAVSDLLTPTAPEAAELESYFREHLQDYAAPPRYWLTQIYLDPDRRGDAVLEEAGRLREQLNASAEPPADLRSLGDSLMVENEFAGYTAAELARHFGRPFAEELTALEPGVWHGPVLSGYGVHVVRIVEVVTSPPPELDEVSEQVRADWVESQRDALNAQYRESLMAAYDIEVEEASVPVLDPGGAGRSEAASARADTATGSAEGGF